MHIMGILNVTPDSFSDGGKWESADAAIEHGRQMLAAGATIIDVGGESTRPGATMVSAEDEWNRIAPVITDLSQEAMVSVDTYHARTAALAVEHGARIVNDVTGGSGDSQMFSTVAALECDYILQHGRGNAQTMNDLAIYEGSVAAVVAAELAEAKEKALAAGIANERIILDPGLGFAKVGNQDWQLLAGLEQIINLGNRILVGHSRKRFLDVTAPGRGVQARDTATAALSGILSEYDVWAVRVHDVAATRSAIEVHHQLRAGKQG